MIKTVNPHGRPRVSVEEVPTETLVRIEEDEICRFNKGPTRLRDENDRDYHRRAKLWKEHVLTFLNGVSDEIDRRLYHGEKLEIRRGEKIARR